MESRNKESAQIPCFWIPMVKWCNGIFLWSKIEPHTGLGFCVHRSILFTPGHVYQLTSPGCLRWDDLFSGWTVSIWRHGNWTRGTRFLIREKSHYTILPLESRNKESLGFWATGLYFLLPVCVEEKVLGKGLQEVWIDETGWNETVVWKNEMKDRGGTFESEHLQGKTLKVFLFSAHWCWCPLSDREWKYGSFIWYGVVIVSVIDKEK